MKPGPEAEKLVKEFGAKLISEMEEVPDFFTFKKGLIYSHRDFDEFYTFLKKGERCAVVSGFNASGSIHIGHLPLFKTNLYFQKKYGMEVFLPISDDESYVTGKVDDQKQGLINSMKIAKQILALGFDPEKTHFIIDQIFTNIYNLAIMLSRGVTYSQIKATYGYSNEVNPGVLFYPAIQSAHILMPQTKDFGEIKNVLVPIGLDEDSHIRICRDVAPKFGFKKPAIIHSLFIPGLDGDKMKKSKPETAIFLNDSMEDIKRKVGKALTGGKETLEKQKAEGGNPDACIVAQYLNLLYMEGEDYKELEIKCRSGEIMCGNCKKMLTEKLQEEIKSIQDKMKEISDENVDKAILKDNNYFTAYKKDKN